MLRRGRIGEGWLGEIYAGEDPQGRLVRLIGMADFTAEQRDWILQRHRLMTRVAVVGACPQIGVEFVNGTLYWVGAWREAVQLSLVLEEKYLPNSVIMSIASSLIESLYSAEQQGISHGCLDANGIWLGHDGQIWIDGYGEVCRPETSTKDVFDVGRLTIEMFLGACSFPIEDASEAKQALIQTGVELKALGLPGKLPRQILQMVLSEPDKRPSIGQVRKRWKISKASEIIQRWVQEHYKQQFSNTLPEERLPISERIAPSPFPVDLIEEADDEHSIVLPDIGLFSPSNDVTSVMEVLEDDDTFIRSDLEDTQEVPIEMAESVVETEEVSFDSQEEVTQEIAFFSEAESSFFDFDLEETSQLTNEESPRALKTEDVTLGDSDVELETVMVTSSRRPLMGIVWIVLIASLTAGGLFWTIPSIPSVVEATPEEVEDVFIEPVRLQPVGIPTVQPVLETAVIEDSTELIGDSNEVVEAIVTNPEPEPVVVQRTRQQSTPKTNVIKEPKESKKPKESEESKESNTQASEPKVSEPQALKREVVQSEKPALQNIAKDVATPVQSVETMVEEPIEPVEPVEAVTPEEEVEPEPPANGVVKIIGDAAVLRLKKDGQEQRGGGEYAPGVYDVYVTFEGFSEFQLQKLTVVSGQTHIIKCNAMFATCQYK